jgi:membrane protease YdiL (CAAX protease family)
MEKNVKLPLLKAILFTFVPLIFATIAGTIISIKSLNGNYIIIAQSVAFALSIFVGLIIMKKLHLTLLEIGFCKMDTRVKNVLFFIPLLIIEILPFFTGLNDKNNIPRILLLIVFTIIVGINEELYWRGIILKLFTNNIVKAIIISSVLFGIGHIVNALAIENYLYIILQIIFAFIIGLIFAEIVIITKSIIPAIIFHTIHDFVANITNDSVEGIALLILGIQLFVLIVYAIILWRKSKKIR